MEQNRLGPPGSTPTHAGAEPPTQHPDGARAVAGKAVSVSKEKIAERANSMAAERKAQASGTLRQVAGALRDVGRTLDDDGFGQVRSLTDRAAEQVERSAGYLDRRDLGGLVRDTRELARRHPEVFLGGMLLAGVLIGRFLRASAPEDDEEAYAIGELPSESPSTPRPSIPAPGEELRPADSFRPGGGLA